MLLSSCWIKRRIYKQVELTLVRLPPKTPEEREKEKCEIHKIFDWEGAELIGFLERFLYVYAVLEVPAWPLNAGWLAMKAFFIRLAEPHELEASRRQSIYHLYLYVNIISVTPDAASCLNLRCRAGATFLPFKGSPSSRNLKAARGRLEANCLSDCQARLPRPSRVLLETRRCCRL